MLDDDLPIRSDDDVLRLVREVIGDDGVRGRTAWVLLLDADDRPMPTVIPVEGVPVDPDPDHVARFAEAVGAVLQAVGGSRAIIAWERDGGGAVRMQEADWAGALAATGLPLRAQLLATDDGVRLLDPDFERIVAG